MAPASAISRSSACIAGGVAVVAMPSAAVAFEAEIQADTDASSWQVRGPAGAAILSLRRITQTLTLAGASRSDDPRAPVIRVRARLRIDSDFGTSCQPGTDACLDELNQSRASDFAPLFARRAVDLPFAYVEVAGLGRGVVDLRAGRQLLVDSLGFMLFDGALARVNLARMAHVETWAGLETRAGFPLSNGRFERDGLLRADRDGWDRSLAAAVVDREAATVAGVALDVHPSRRVEGRFTWRRTWGASGISEEAAAARASLEITERTRIFAEAVYMIPLATVSLASAGIEGPAPRRGRWSIEASRVRPTFDLTSVWASFWIDPTDELRASFAMPISRAVDVAASAWVRRYALDEERVAGQLSLGNPVNAGGSVALRVRRPRWDAAARGFAEGGDAGSRVNASVEFRAWAIPRTLRIDGVASYAHVADALRPERTFDGAGFVAGAMVPLGRIAEVGASVEDDVNGLVGHRIRVVGMVRLRNIP